MNLQQLKELLTRPEWAEVEIKKSARDFPADACSTYAPLLTAVVVT